MAEQQEDYSNLPLEERATHKVCLQFCFQSLEVGFLQVSDIYVILSN